MTKPFRIMSTGERQRVLIARALMIRPKLLILDEPCAGLDIAAREFVLRTAERAATQRGGPSLILTTHHVEEVTPVFSHCLMLSRGQVFARGKVAEVLRSSHPFGIVRHRNQCGTSPWSVDRLRDDLRRMRACNVSPVLFSLDPRCRRCWHKTNFRTIITERSTMPKLQIGVIGVGSIGNAHLEGYSQLSDRVEIKALCDVNPKRLKEMAAKFSVPAEHCYPNHRDMLKNEKLGAVSVCTPNLLPLRVRQGQPEPRHSHAHRKANDRHHEGGEGDRETRKGKAREEHGGVLAPLHLDERRREEAAGERARSASRT